MAEVLLVNPRRRGRPGRRRRRSPAQAAATRKLVALNRKRPAKRRRRRRNPIGPYAKSGNMGYYVSNPRRRKRRAPARRRRSRARYRRNPMTMRGIINSTVMPAAQAAGGAIALDIAWGFVPLPGDLKTGPMRHVAKGLGAIVIGRIASQFLSRKIGDNMAMGALTVVFHSAFRELLANVAPQIPLSNIGYYSAGADAGYDPTLGNTGYYVGSPRMAIAGGESVPAGTENSEMGYYVQEGAGSQY